MNLKYDEGFLEAAVKAYEAIGADGFESFVEICTNAGDIANLADLASSYLSDSHFMNEDKTNHLRAVAEEMLRHQRLECDPFDPKVRDLIGILEMFLELSSVLQDDNARVAYLKKT